MVKDFIEGGRPVGLPTGLTGTPTICCLTQDGQQHLLVRLAILRAAVFLTAARWPQSSRYQGEEQDDLFATKRTSRNPSAFTQISGVTGCFGHGGRWFTVTPVWGNRLLTNPCGKAASARALRTPGAQAKSTNWFIKVLKNKGGNPAPHLDQKKL